MRGPRLPAIMTLVTVLALSAHVVSLSSLAGFDARTTNPANTFTHALFFGPYPPTNLTPTHPSPTSGEVDLSWTASSSADVTGYTVQRATSPSGPFAAVTTLAGSATSYNDTGTAYNTQYYYQVVARAGSRSAATATAMALSLAPTSGTDTTGSGTVTLSGSDLGAVAVADVTTYSNAGRWGSSGTQYLQFGFTPTPASGAAISSVRVTVVYAVAKPKSVQQVQLLVSPDGGSSWTTYDLTIPSTTADFQASVDISSLIKTQTALRNLLVRFVVVNQSTGTGQGTENLIHVDVN